MSENGNVTDLLFCKVIMKISGTVLVVYNRFFVVNELFSRRLFVSMIKLITFFGNIRYAILVSGV